MWAKLRLSSQFSEPNVALKFGVKGSFSSDGKQTSRANLAQGCGEILGVPILDRVQVEGKDVWLNHHLEASSTEILIPMNMVFDLDKHNGVYYGFKNTQPFLWYIFYFVLRKITTLNCPSQYRR